MGVCGNLRRLGLLCHIDLFWKNCSICYNTAIPSLGVGTQYIFCIYFLYYYMALPNPLVVHEVGVDFVCDQVGAEGM